MLPSARKDRKELAGLRANAAAVSPARLVARRRRVQGAPATPQAIAAALHGYVGDIADNVADRGGRVPTTVLVSPIWIDDAAPWFAEVTGGSFDRTGVARSRELAGEISRVAQELGVRYADAAQVARAGNDGLHLTLDSHAPLAELVASTIDDVQPHHSGRGDGHARSSQGR